MIDPSGTGLKVLGAAADTKEVPERRWIGRLSSSVAALAAGVSAFGVSNIVAGSPSASAAPAPSTHAGGQVVAEAAIAGGYWSTLSNGQVTAAGTASWDGDLHGQALNRSIVSMASTPDGRGYWLVASDGGIFSFGDAGFFGSEGASRLNRPIVSMASTPDGRGYWLVASDGGIFSFGDVGFFGSAGGYPLNQPIVGMAPTPDGQGYWLVASDGGVFAFGAAGFRGSLGGNPTGGDTVGIAAQGAGYWILSGRGGATAFSAPPVPGPPPPPPLIIAPGQNPPSSLAPSAAFAASCYSGENNAACDANALADVNSARAGEGLGALALPSNYEQLSQATQLIVVANAERTSRGLPAFAANASLDAFAALGAQHVADPSGPASTTWASVLASGYAAPLAADFAWMYDDGPNGTNADCPPTGGSGCWDHRHNILVGWGGAAGAGVTVANGVLQLTTLFVANY